MSDNEQNKFIDIVTSNILEDRKRLVDLYDDLEQTAEMGGLIEKAAASESLVKIVDSLTKQTSQLVELAKLKEKNKKVVVENEDDFSADECSEIFDTLDSSETLSN